MMTGEKTFDIRLNDRDFQVGDTIKMREWNPKTKEYTGRGMAFNIVYITKGIFGQLQINTVCMQLEPMIGLSFFLDSDRTINDLILTMAGHKIKKFKGSVIASRKVVNFEVDHITEQTQ